MTTHALSLEALEHALATAKRRAGADLVHHSDCESQYLAIAYTERLAEAGIQPSVGTVGDSYDRDGRGPGSAIQGRICPEQGFLAGH